MDGIDASDVELSEAVTEPLEAPVVEATPSELAMLRHVVLEKLRRGEPIQRTKIEGLKLKGEFTQPIQFLHVTLVDLVIDKATFRGEVIFENCTLDRAKIGTHQATFEKGLNLAGSILIKPDLRRIIVKRTLRCDRIRVRGPFRVDSSRFEGPLKFWEARFEGWVDFKKSEMLDVVDFRSIHADEGFALDDCQFRSDVLCRGATIHKKFQADNSRFEGLLDLSKAKLFDFVYLEEMKQGERQTFAFANALAERILIRPDQLQGRLACEEKGEFAQAMQEYGLLKRNFEALHRFEDEDWAFYRFKVNQRRCKTRSWRRPWTMCAGCADWLLLDHGCGYGTNPVRAVRTAALIILGFALIYGVGIESFNIDPGEKMPFAGDKATLANRLMIGTLTSVSTFTSGFADVRGAVQGWMNLPLIAESLMGTLLWGLFIVAFSRKVIR